MTGSRTLLAISTDSALHRPRLWLRSTEPGAEWKSLKLEFDVKRRSKVPARKNFWLGYNGTRWARNTDAAYLALHHPEVMTWAEAALQAAP